MQPEHMNAQDGNKARRFTAHMMLEPACDVQAGSVHTWLLTYTVDREGIRPGGGIRIAVDLRTGIDRLQVDDPLGRGYVTCRASVPVELAAYAATVMHPLSVDLAQTWNPEMSTSLYVVDIAVRGDVGLGPGEQIFVTIGDRSHGGPGITAPTVAVDDLRFWVLIDSGREVARGDCPAELHFDSPKASGMLIDGHFVHAVGSPSVRVLPGPPAHLEVIAPSRGHVGENIPVLTVTYDKYWNPITARRVRVKIPGEVGTKRESVPLEFSPEGTWFRVVGEEPEGKLKAKSNPVEIDRNGADGPHIYWGDIHGHSLLSDGSLGEPDDYFNYARHIAGLDFCALTDHDFGLAFRGVGAWERVQNAVRRHHDPGHFVTFLAFESTHCRRASTGEKAGHKNVYFPDDAGRLVNTSPYYGPARAEMRGRTVEDLFDALSESGALVIAHQNSNTDWTFAHPDQRLVEIYSKWGCSEYSGCSDMVRGMRPNSSVQTALAGGHQLGFVAGSDTHIAQPANKHEPDPAGRCDTRPGGLTAVSASSLTRSALWDALWNRRTYATTGARIILTFRVNDACMGEVLHCDGVAKIHVQALGTAPVQRLEIIKNNQIVHKLNGNEENISYTWEDPAPRAGDYYYVRILQRDGHRAWSSPIWID